MIKRRPTHLIPILVPLVLGGCSTDAIGPDEFTVDGLRLQVEVSPSSIDRQETLLATLRIVNLTDEPVELVSSCTALALVKTFHGEERVDLEGTVLGCFDAITPFEIGAQQTLIETYEIRAVRHDAEPVDRGTYVLQVDFMVPELPDLEASWEVR